MATQTVCGFNKFGFCKYQEKCRKFHEKNICKNQKCEVKKCLLRHPKICKFLRDYGYCKFGEWCFFSHKPFEIKNNIEKKEFEELKENIDKIDKEIKSKDEVIKSLEI